MAQHPETIGPYRVLKALASGGMAEVFEVEDPSSGERLAVKLLQNLKVALRRFNREYEAMARLNHPGVVRVYHYGLHRTRPWLSMELLQGENAHIWTKRFGPPGTREREEEVLRVSYHLATALNYVHDRGLVHRDLKSANVMVLPDARVKLVDFGTAHLVDAAERITREGEFVGTFAYASPEQLQSTPVTPKSDLYSLGILLYRLSTGRRPFSARDPGELAWQHLNEPAPDPRTFVENMPGPLAELILALVRKKPADRPENAGLVAEAIERLAGRPFSTRSAVALHRTRSTFRHRERGTLWKKLRRSPAGTLWAVVGDAGSDVDRFLDDVVDDAMDRGWYPVQCALRPRHDLTDLTRLFLSLSHGLEHQDNVAEAVEQIRHHSRLERRTRPESRAALVQAATRLVIAREQAGHGSVLVVVGNASAAGPISTEVLADLLRELRRRDATFSMVLGTRTADHQPSSPLSPLLTGCRRMELAPLGPADVAFATGTMLGRRPPPARLARRLHEVSGGQPVYLEHVVRRMVGAGEVLAEDNRVEWAAPVDLEPPPQALDDAEALVCRLPLSQVRVLEMLTLAEGGDVALLAGAFGWAKEELRPVLDRLVASGLIRWDDPDRTRPAWSHSAVARLLRSRMSPLRRSVLTARLARTLEDSAPSPVRVRALTAAGRPLEAAKIAGSVCRELFESHKVLTALGLLDPVVRGLAGTAVPNSPAVAEVFLLHSLCLQAVNPSHPDTARTLGVARRMVDRPPAMVARIQWGQATLARSIGHYQSYARFVDTALSSLGTDPRGALLHAWLRIEQGDARRLQGNLSGAIRSYQVAEEIGRKKRVMRLLARSTAGLAACKCALGELAESERQASRAMTHLERIRDLPGYWKALAVWGQAMRRQGRYSDVLSVLYQRAPEARHHEDPRSYSALILALAWCELDLERLGRAQEYVDELVATTGKGEHLHVRLETGLVHGRILIASGQRRQAAYTLQDVERRARRAELRVIAEQARAWHAEALWSLGDKEAARGMFQSAVLGLMGLGVRPALADAVAARARARARETDVDELLRPLEGWVSTERAPLFRLEELLARGTAARRQGDRTASRRFHREAAMVLNRVASQLNDTDRAALRVHSWSRRIRRGLR